jgi:hypothetical protein
MNTSVGQMVDYGLPFPKANFSQKTKKPTPIFDETISYPTLPS